MKKPELSKELPEQVMRRLYWLERLIDEEYEGSPAVFERRTQIKMAQVNQWFSGYRLLRENARDRLLEATGKPKEYFDRDPAGVNDPDTASEVWIPEYATGGAMGRGLVLQDQPGVIKKWVVSPDWLQKNIHRITAPQNLCIVTGFGDSMRGIFNPGDPLIVDQGVKRADIDGIYFFRVGEEGFVKRLQRIPTLDGVVLRAKSENPAYDPFDIVKGMDFEVFGRVVKAWQSQDF